MILNTSPMYIGGYKPKMLEMKMKIKKLICSGSSKIFI